MPSLTFRALGLCCALALAVGCNNATTQPGRDTGTTNPGEDAATPADDTGTVTPHDAAVYDAGPFSTDCRTLTFPSVHVTGGMENTQCVILDLGNDLPLHVGSIHNVLPEASHHFIVYRASATATETTTPFDCTPFVDTLSADSGSPLMITQRADETLTLPPGVAYTLPAHQLMRLELHYINLTGTAVDVSPTATLCPAATYTDEADFLFIGNPDVNVPAHSTATLGPTFYRLDSRFSGAHFFALTGHTHQLGTNVIIQTGVRAGPFTDVYNVPSWSWQEPDVVVSDPPFVLPANGGFNFTCEWNNPTNTAVGFGESATAEMCFFWAYYYPAHAGAPHVCVHTDQIAGGFDLCCPGSPVCAMLSSRF